MSEARWQRAVERGLDVALGASAVSWAVLGLLHAEERALPVRVAIAALNLAVGLLFLVRRAPIASGSIGAILAALPSMIVAGAAVRLSDGAWPWPAAALFALGAAGTLASLLWLGRSFAVFPSRRGLVAGGPYALVRHPAYACELLMVAACAIARPWPVAPLALVALGAALVRIHAEERLLGQDEAYAEYRARVRYRLVPLVL